MAIEDRMKYSRFDIVNHQNTQTIDPWAMADYIMGALHM